MTCPHVESLRTRRRIVHLLQKLWIAAPKALWIRDRARLTRELTGQTRTIFQRGSAAGEEVLQQCAAFVLEDAAAYVDAMVQSWVAYDIEE